MCQHGVTIEQLEPGGCSNIDRYLPMYCELWYMYRDNSLLKYK